MTNHPPLKALCLAIATLLLQQTQVAIAAPTNAELNSVKLYGNVTIAQDSVNGWGPWTEFEPPAAGGPPLSTIPVTSEPYRTLPQVATPVTPPVPTPPIPAPTPDHDLIGFGVFHSLMTSPGGQDVIDGPHPISVTGTTVTPASTGSWLPDSFEMTTTPITGVYPPPNSVLLSMQEGGVYTGNTETQQTLMELVESPDGTNDAQATEASFYKFLSYILSPEDRLPQVVTQFGVVGYRTSAADMLDLHGRNVVATYNGHSATNASIGFVPMSMVVNFGDATWTGVWNGGADNNGAVGFRAAGGITGATFNSTPGSITATDSNNISGRVTGAFFGPMAAAAGGVADVTKNGVRHVNPFLAVRAAPQVSTPTPSIPQGTKAQ